MCNTDNFEDPEYAELRAKDFFEKSGYEFN